MFAIRRILHATDFSPHADLAFRAARDLAQKYQAELVLLHVTMPMVIYGEMDTNLFRDPVNRKQAEDQLQCMLNVGPRIHTQCYVVEGDPSREIVQAAKDKDCDLIVIGSHGRRGLSRLLLGSVAQDVLRKAPCPVLVINHPSHNAPNQPVDEEFSEPAVQNVVLTSFLSELLQVLKIQARETERLSEHVERHTNKLLEPSQMGLVISELTALQAHLDGVVAVKS